MKNLTRLVALCLLVFNLELIQAQQNTFNLQVKADGIKEIHISQYDFESESMQKLRSFSSLSADKLAFEIPFSEPSLYLFELDAHAKIRVAVENAGPIQMLIGEEVKVISDVAQISNFDKSIQELNEKIFAKLIQEFDKAQEAGDQDKIAELMQKKDELLLKFIAEMEDLVRKMGPSALAYDALSFFDLHKNQAFIREMSQTFNEQYPGSSMSLALKRRLEEASRISLGKPAPAFSALDREGKQISLETYRGSYLLVDFWASWCRACRVENPKFVELYELHHEKGFEVLSISIDADKAVWYKAIDKDGLLWKQVLDKELTIYKLYFLSSLPANFLIDPQGNIIARNLTAESLKGELEKL